MKMKASMHVGPLGSAVAALLVVCVAGLILNVRMTSVLTPDGSQQVKAKATHSHDADWALEIAGSAATAFRFEMEHGNNDDDNDDMLLSDTGLSVSAQSSQVKVAGIYELMEYSFWAKNGFCKMIQNNFTVPDAHHLSSQLRLPTHQPPALPVAVNFTFGCKELFEKSVLGTGNWLSSF
jgi:hypothetical protein